MIAHLGGLPVEEALLPLSGAGVWLLLARAWVASHVRRGADGPTVEGAQRGARR